MGKSRTVDALRAHRYVSYYLIICQCSSYHTNSALHPIIRQLERAADIASEDTPKVKLETLLSKTDNLSDATRSLFADLLSIPLDGRALDLPPVQRKAAIIAAIVYQLAKLSEQRPVFFVLEDAHWIDPTTQEFVTRLLDHIDTPPGPRVDYRTPRVCFAVDRPLASHFARAESAERSAVCRAHRRRRDPAYAQT
jgi:predicted ATPase